MIGYLIEEIERVCPGAEYQRFAQNVGMQNTALYYSYVYRHALLTRHRVVYASIANIHVDDAQQEWLRRDELLRRPQRTLPVERHDWQSVLMTDAVSTEANALGMLTALRAVYSAVHDEFGRMNKSVRPAGLREVLELAFGVLSEVNEDVREALRATRPTTQAQADDDARRQQEQQGQPCDSPFFLKGECTICGQPFVVHGLTKASGARRDDADLLAETTWDRPMQEHDREYGRVEGDDDPDSLNYTGR